MPGGRNTDIPYFAKPRALYATKTAFRFEALGGEDFSEAHSDTVVLQSAFVGRFGPLNKMQHLPGNQNL